MTDGEPTDAADGGANAENTDEGSSLDPFPAVDRDADRPATDSGSTAGRGTGGGDSGTGRRTGDTGGDDDHGHTCDPDSPVPCQFH